MGFFLYVLTDAFCIRCSVVTHAAPPGTLAGAEPKPGSFPNFIKKHEM